MNIENTTTCLADFPNSGNRQNRMNCQNQLNIQNRQNRPNPGSMADASNDALVYSWGIQAMKFSQWYT